MRTCQVCGSGLVRQINVKGFSNLWSNDLSHNSIFKFFICESCGFIHNSDYGDFSFTSKSYDNYTAVSDSDLKERLLARKISESVSCMLKSYSRSLNIIEVGSGKRLGMLKELSTLLPNSDIFAVDPVLGDQLFVMSANTSISTASNLFALEVSPSSLAILIFRNSLEYFSPADLRKAFNLFYSNGGLLLTEFTSIDIPKQGYAHLYSECLNFYQASHISSILNDCALSSLPLEASKIHGSDRTLSLIKIFSNEEMKNTFLCRSLKSLISSLKRSVAINNSKSIMYGAGGRNIMALLNHLDGMIDGFYDSDLTRSSALLPFSLQFVDKASVARSCNIVLLNSSFLPCVREIFPENPIFVLATS